jgi:uncharacterized membrane protein
MLLINKRHRQTTAAPILRLVLGQLYGSATVAYTETQYFVLASRVKAQTPLFRFVVELLYNRLYSKSKTNPQQVEQMEFELNTSVARSQATICGSLT